MAQITSNLMVCPTACSGWQQRKHQGSPLLALCLGNPWCLVGFPSQRPVIWKPFQCHDLIMKRWIFPSDVVALEDSIDGSVRKHTKLEAPCCYYTPRTTKLLGGYTGFTPSVRPSVRPSVCPSRMPCPLCIIYSYGWILFILGTNDHYHERVCRAPWPLTLTYIFKVIWPWLRKSCPLCSVYSSGWILSVLGTNDHYH